MEMTNSIMLWIASGSIFLGVCFLALSLFPLFQLVRQLSTGSLQRYWIFLILLVIFFIVGYSVYGFHFRNRYGGFHDLIVPVIFLSGAIFVLMVGNLAQRTVIDMQRIARLKRESITDALMSIYNRRYFNQRLDEESQRAWRYQLSLSLLMLDIDFFKNVNDDYGHHVGDTVLSHLAQVLLHAVRETDIVARYGGEEIVIIAPQTPIAEAFDLAERLRRVVEDSIMVAASSSEKRPEVRITISIGVSALRREEKDGKKALIRADQAMYIAKQQGRNRVAGAGEESFSPPV